ECQTSVICRAGFGVAPQPEKHLPQAELGHDRAWIESLRLPETVDRRAPVSEISLDLCRRREELGVGRCEPLSFRVLLECAAGIVVDGDLVISQGHVSFRLVGGEGELFVCRPASALVQLARGRAVSVQAGARERYARPCLCKRGVEGHGLL